MATKKISELVAITEADSNDVLVVVDVSEGTTNKITKGNLLVGAGHTIEMTIDTNYQLVLKLKNEAGTVLSTQSIDLPNENAVTNIEYNNGNLVLTKQSGATSQVDISGLINGLVTETDFNTFVTTMKNVIGINTNTYNTTETYNTGDIVVQSEKIYKAKQDNITGTFDSTKWDEISLYEYQKIQDEKVEENYKEITKLQTQVNTLKEITSQMPQVSDSGEEAYLADTIKAPFTEFEVKGHSEQETTTGKNWFPTLIETVVSSDGIIFTPNKDGSYKVQGTSTKNNAVLISETFNQHHTIPAGTYMFSCEGASSSCYVQFYDNTNKKYIVTLSNKVVTFETDIDAYAFTINIPTSGTTVNTTLYPQLEPGSSKTDFEKYSGGYSSPSPNWKQPVKSCGENVNILDEEWEQGAYSNVDGTSKIDSNQYVRTKNFSSIEPNKEYAFKGVVKSAIQISGDLLFYQEDGTFISRLGLSTPFTSPNNAKKIKVNFYNSNGIVPEDVDYVKLELGSQATPWSPYGMGCVNEKVQNKNWLKMDTPGTYTINGVTFKTNGDGSVTVTGTSTNYIYAYVKDSDGYVNTVNSPDARKIKVPANVPVTLSGKSTNVRLVIRNITDSTTIQGTTATFSKETNIAIQFYIPTGTTVNETLYPMLEFSSTATSYVPHEEQTKIIPTQQPMRSIGDVRDDFVKIDGVRYERHKVGRYVFTGNEDFTKLPDNAWGANSYLYTSLNNFKSWGSSLSNYFIDAGLTTSRILTNGEMQIAGTGLVFKNDNTNSVVELKSWQAEQYANGTPVYVDYILQEPTLLPCTQAQSDILDSLTETVHTYRGGTYISSPDEVKARIKVSGLKDLNVMFENLTNAVLLQGSNT